MKVLSKYRLELHWDEVIYKEDVAFLKGAYFTGPVLKDAAKLEEEDEIILDLTSQHSIFIPDHYQAVLHWKGIEYLGDRIYLKEAWIKGRYVNSIETLKDHDWILINCKGHDIKDMEARKGKRLARGLYTNIYNHLLVYWSEVCKENREAKY